MWLLNEQVYAAHTAPGLEMVAWEEIQARLGPASLVKRGEGLFLFTYDGPPSGLLGLRTTEDIFAVIHYSLDLVTDRRGLSQIHDGLVTAPAFEAALGVYREVHPRRVKRITYRVVVQKKGRHAFRRLDAQEYAIKAIQERYGRWKFLPEDAHLEVWLDIQDKLAVSMIRLSERTMRHRKYKLAHIPASLRPTIAYAMVFLSAPQDQDVFLDPMCGAGTILIERALGGRAAAIIGGDLDAEAVAAAQMNSAPYPRIQLVRWDATHLPLAAGTVHKVVSNLPFGKQIGSPERNETLYRGFFAEMDRVLAPRGRAVLLSSERGLLGSLLRERIFTSRRTLPVTVLGQAAAIYVLERTQELGDI